MADGELEVNSSTTIRLTDKVESNLLHTEPWVRFLSIVAFGISGLHIAAPLIVAGVLKDAEKTEGFPFLWPHIVLGIVYVFPSLYLTRYAAEIRHFHRARDVKHLEAALDAQRSFWKFTGVFVAVPVAIIIVAFVVFTLISLVNWLLC